MPRAPWLADSTPRSTTTGVDTSLMFMVIPRLSTNHRGCSTASYGCRLGGHNHLAIPHPEHVRQIVYMLQRKIEISDLTRSTQVIHALAAQAGLYRGGAPAIDDGRSSLVFRFIPCGDELARQQGVRELSLKQQRRFHRRNRKTTPPRGHGGNRCRRRANHVNGHNGVAIPINFRILLKGSNDYAISQVRSPSDRRDSARGLTGFGVTGRKFSLAKASEWSPRR